MCLYLVSQSCLTLYDPCQAPMFMESLQASILEWVAMPPPGDLSYAGIKPRSPALQEDFLMCELPEKPYYNLSFMLLYISTVIM